MTKKAWNANHDFLFNEIAIRQGLLDAEQALDAMRAQSELRTVFERHLFVGLIHLVRGTLSLKQTDGVLRAMGFPQNEDDSHPRLKLALIGEVLVDMGAINASQLLDALDEQTRLDRQGTHKRLGELLLETGAISQQALDEALVELERRRAGKLGGQAAG